MILLPTKNKTAVGEMRVGVGRRRRASRRRRRMIALSLSLVVSSRLSLGSPLPARPRWSASKWRVRRASVASVARRRGETLVIFYRAS